MKITSLLSDKPYSTLAIAICFVILLALPWLHLLPADSSLHLSAYWVTFDRQDHVLGIGGFST